jgi:hypothetical protein
LNIDEDDDGQKAATAPPKKQSAPVPKSERVIVADGDELFLKIVKAVRTARLLSNKHSTSIISIILKRLTEIV